MPNQKVIEMENKKHKIICQDCKGNGYRKNYYDEVYQCPTCKSQGEIMVKNETLKNNIKFVDKVLKCKESM